MSGEAERVDAYLDTVSRIEPDIAMLDQGAALASIAISMKRVADTLEDLNKPTEHGRDLGEKLYYAILNPLSEAMAQWARHR